MAIDENKINVDIDGIKDQRERPFIPRGKRGKYVCLTPQEKYKIAKQASEFGIYQTIAEYDNLGKELKYASVKS